MWRLCLADDIGEFLKRTTTAVLLLCLYTPHDPPPPLLNSKGSLPILGSTSTQVKQAARVDGSTSIPKPFPLPTMSILRPFARAMPIRSLRTPIRTPLLRRSMASTPDSSHVSEHKVDAAHGATPQDVHGAHHEDHYDPPVRFLAPITTKLHIRNPCHRFVSPEFRYCGSEKRMSERRG